MLTTTNNKNVCFALGDEARQVVMALPPGKEKEELAGPISRYEPCEKLITVTNDIDTYHILLIVGDDKSRIVFVANNAKQLYWYISTLSEFPEAITKRWLSVIYNTLF